MKNLIIDGGNLLHRTYHASKGKGYVNDEGKDFSHIVLFLKNIKHLKDMFGSDRVFIAWDIRNKDFINFRQETGDYKDHRDRTENEDVHKFDKILWVLTESLGITNIRAEKLEGDDIIYFIVRKYNDSENVVVSNDNDFLQLFHNYENIKIYNPNKDVLITESNSKQYNGGVDNDKFVFYKAIMGDPSDNIKGLHMYGPVKSKKFVENLKDNFVKLSSEEKELLKHNLKMINLKNGLEIYPDEEEYYESQDIQPEPSMSKFFDIIDKLGIKNYMGYRSDWTDHFGKNKSNIIEGLQNILKSINN